MTGQTDQTGQINTDNEAVAQVTWSDGRRGAGTRYTDGTMYKTCISGVSWCGRCCV